MLKEIKYPVKKMNFQEIAHMVKNFTAEIIEK
jgi:hypothetical protein